jgi:hypothetical protein
MANRTFLDLPPFRTIMTSFGLVGIFLALAYGLYCWNEGSNAQYGLKVADAFINGAIVGLFFAMVKLIFDLPKLGAAIITLFRRLRFGRGAVAPVHAEAVKDETIGPSVR